MLRWLLGLFLLAATTLSAFSREPFGLAIVDESGRLERAALEKAARPLLARGAAIAVVLVRQGGRQDAVKQLSQLGLLSGSQISPSGLFLYVSLEPHYSELRAGARFSDELPAGQLEQIRNQTLNPQLRAEHYQQSFDDSLGELERRLAHNLSLNDKLKAAVLILLVLGTLSLLGFWDWFWETPPGRGLDWLWSLTPMARARRRREQELGRLASLHWLQTQYNSLERAQQSLEVWSRAHQVELENLCQEVKAAPPLSAAELVALRIRVEAETKRLEKLQSQWTSAGLALSEAQRVFQSIRSSLKARKKTRPLLEAPEMQGLEAELRQESELRKRYSQEGADRGELEQSELRCGHLLQRARELALVHRVEKKTPAAQPDSWSPTSSAGEWPSSTSSSSSSSNDGGSSYDPPGSSSESWAGGDW